MSLLKRVSYIRTKRGDDMEDNETQDDTVIVDVETGERSDSRPSFDIIKHDDGKQYIKADQVEEYKAHKADEYKTIQSELDNVLSEIDAIDQLNTIEERQSLMREFVAKNGDDYDLSEFVDFGNGQEFDEFMSYLQTLSQSSYSDPSAGFGPAKQPQSNTPKMQYEAGRKMARQVYEGRR